MVLKCQPETPPWARLLLRVGLNLNLGMLPQRIAGHPHAKLAMPSVSLPKWGDVSTTASGPLPLATLEAPDASGKEEEFCFETPAPALPWPSPQHLVN